MVKPVRTVAALAIGVVVAAGVICFDRGVPVQAAYQGDPGLVAYTEREVPTGGGVLSEIYTMKRDGSDQRQVTFDSGTFVKTVQGCDEMVDVYTKSYEPTWSPDGRLLAFLHHTADDRIEVRAFDPIVESTQVLFDDWQAATMLSWSPDGSKIAYGDDDGVWVADADGSDATLIAAPTPNLPPVEHGGFESVEWSPDGQRLAFIEWSRALCASGSSYVNVVDVDGRNRRSNVCAGGPPRSYQIDWAPDGRALVCDTQGSGDSIMTVNPDGSDLTVVAEGGSPVWSPDGASILYGRGQPWEEQRELWSYDVVAGSTSRSLAEFRGDEMAWQALQQVPYPIGLVDPDRGIWRVVGDDGYVTSFFYGNPGDVPFVGDWDGDATATPGLFRQSDAFAYLRNSNSQGIADIRFFFGNPSDIPLAGDFDGDGKDTLSIYRPSEQRFYIINKLGENEGGLGAADYSFLFGNPGDKPVVGDWDGDGIDEVGLHRESTGFFYWRNTLTTGVADGEIFFGDPGDRFVAGDWGIVDGNDTPGLFRPSDVTFYFRHTLTQGVADSQFTWPGAGTTWLPVAG